MLASNVKKNKVELTDYNYQRDIENRLLISKLTTFELDVINEILDGSLKTSVEELADNLNTNEAQLLPVLKKLSKTKLFQISNDNVIIDKEMRKYFECQMIKFEEDFEPNMEFLQGLLSKIPIHVLPNWYAISRSSDHIFNSIVEKYLLTPRIYERYLHDLVFDDPVLKSISQEVFASPELKVSARELIAKHSLTPERFEECMLHLEFNLVCCLSYQRVNDYWEEVVTPFYEWKEYLEHINRNNPKSICDTENIKREHPHDFGFTKDLFLILKGLHKTPLQLAGSAESIKPKDLGPYLPHLDQIASPCEYSKHLIKTLLTLQLAEISSKKVHPAESAKEWLDKPVQDQAIGLYRHFINSPRGNEAFAPFTDRDIREIEKSLKKVVTCGWVYLDDFLDSFIASIGSSEATTLKNKGKKWKYTIPMYSEADLAFVRTTIKERFFEAGLVSTGTHNGKVCFTVTPFGRMTLEY